MKTIAVLAIVASLLATAPSFAATADADSLCGPHGPESYQRPGGYCETIGANRSLSSQGGGLVGEAGGAAVPPPEGGCVIPEEGEGEVAC